MTFELWDTETKNLVEGFDSRTAALKAVQELVSLNPTAYPKALALAERGAEGATIWVAHGHELAALAGVKPSIERVRRSH